jgi:hypothetical protein
LVKYYYVRIFPGFARYSFWKENSESEVVRMARSSGLRHRCGIFHFLTSWWIAWFWMIIWRRSQKYGFNLDQLNFGGMHKKRALWTLVLGITWTLAKYIKTEGVRERLN